MSTGTRVAGQSLPRIDAPGKVTGSAVYAADFALPGMLYGKVFRSAEPHARLVRLETARAAGLPFVAVSFGFRDRPIEALGADAVIDSYEELIPALRRL